MVTSELSPSSWAIEARGLGKSFGFRHALRDVNLRVRKGARLAVFGPNGAGKTTLIKIFSTISKPSRGTVIIDGMDAGQTPEKIRARLGVVSHSTFLYNNLTVSENLRFYGKMFGVPDLENRIKGVVEQVQLSPRLHDRVGTLSHGMQRRVSIARAVLHDPSVLLLDEPESGLDPRATEMMSEILEAINSEERTVLITTHNLERGLELCDEVVILHEGRITYQSPREEINEADFCQTYNRCTGLSG
ncbi:MAG: ABC transporter ATP-binding protein [Dehalococcoidia bacterium]